MQVRKFPITTLLVLISLILTACPQPVPAESTGSGVTNVPSSSSGTSSDPAQDKIKPGGVWIEASISDVENLNPILNTDDASNDVINMIFPALIGGDPFTGAITPDGALAESWETSPDGLTWTFHLRDNVKWSDGDAVDSADFKFTYDAIASDKVETPRKDLLNGIASIETPDPLTIVIKYDEVRCDAINNLGINLLPSHRYKADFSDVMDNPINNAPELSAGPLLFKSWTHDENVTMVRNSAFWDGAPNLEGRIIKVVPDTANQLTQLQNGEIDLMSLQPDQLATAKTYDNINIYNFQDDGYEYLALNMADPSDPQPGVDENGKVIEQKPHPILSDVLVRRAIAHSLDYAAIIDKVFLGQGYQIAANVLPAISWAHDPDLKPYDYNLDIARQLLDEAGWVDSDGDGIREKNGKPLALSMITNAGNTVREDLGTLAQDQLKQVGFDIKYEAIDFGVMIEQMVGQTFDIAVIGWTGTGTDPNDETLWKAEFDTPGSGLNFVSYYNPKVEELMEKGVTAAGCTPEVRAPFYKEIQKLMHDDVAYVFVSGGVGNTAYAKRWGGIDPGTWSFFYNIQQWYFKQ